MIFSKMSQGIYVSQNPQKDRKGYFVSTIFMGIYKKKHYFPMHPMMPHLLMNGFKTNKRVIEFPQDNGKRMNTMINYP